MEKIPREQVLDDMYDPDGGIKSIAARDYYRNNYATEQERNEIDREDQIQDLVCKVIAALLVGISVIAAICH